MDTENTIYDMCLVQIEFGNGIVNRQKATGSIIKFGNNLLLATAAHCIFDTYTKSFTTNLNIYIYIEKLKKRYTISKAYIHKKWIEQGDLQYDTAFALFNTDTFDLNCYNQYAIEPKFNLSQDLYYSIKGLTPRYLKILTKSTTVSGKATQHKEYPNIIQGIKCNNKNGMSGGPWLTMYEGQVVQNSVSSFSFKNNNEILWSPYWGKEIESVLHVACGIHIDSENIIVKKYI
ncbi:trypsin-like serine peptidase [Candidatus Galacturonibacter soehngenii]|uniref:Peptidase S1 domain-containing protein n=1 Tax=Candidatus Galacturonatibacter soehngenii TaxID=2307010 RepID=A0A7V7QIA8_9FIRM|nr:hypothetical protein [Candidatus Galacturonibacter soehngenii]KAB1435927.1 hypothetical protein F7O84_16255 [Candidatus Galacturonibacter soehngenii]